MNSSEDEKGLVHIDSEFDIVTIRKKVRELSLDIGFSVTDVTRIVTSASELTRNISTHANKGFMSWRRLYSSECSGIELVFEDDGPGIPDINQALKPGYSTSGGIGIGLSGAERLMGELEIESTNGKGTRVTVRKWLGKY
jgi:serine/threonine-protein kinase RsbT